MAARKVNRAPIPPPPQQKLSMEDQVGIISLSAENSSDGGDSNRGIPGEEPSRRRQPSEGQSLYRRVTVTDGQSWSSKLKQQQQEQQQNHEQHLQQQQSQQNHQQQPQQQPQQQEQVRLRRKSYIPNKATAPAPPRPTTTVAAAAAATASPEQARARPATVVHQTVYTRPNSFAEAADKQPLRDSRLMNPFVPTPRPSSSQQMPSRAASTSNGNLSVSSRKSAHSRKSANFSGGGGGGFAQKLSRLTNLFRPKSRKPLPQQHFQQQQQQQPQQPHSLRSHNGVFATGSQKNLHTFTYTDAKIYNPNNEVHIGTGRAVRKGRAPLAPDSADATAAAGAAAAEEKEDSERTQVWWNMRTMGATHSSFNADVLLVRNADPVTDYETEMTRF